MDDLVSLVRLCVVTHRSKNSYVKSVSDEINVDRIQEFTNRWTYKLLETCFSLADGGVVTAYLPGHSVPSLIRCRCQYHTEGNNIQVTHNCTTNTTLSISNVRQKKRLVHMSSLGSSKHTGRKSGRAF